MVYRIHIRMIMQELYGIKKKYKYICFHYNKLKHIILNANNNIPYN